MKENTINNEDNNSMFLNKKRKNQLNEKEELIINNMRNDINKLINENGIDENYLKDILFQHNKKGEDDKKHIVIKLEKKMNMNKDSISKIINNMKNVQKSHQSNSIIDLYRKINLFPPKFNNNKNNNFLTLEEDLNWSEDKNKNVITEIKEGDNCTITLHQKNNNEPFHYIYLKDSFSFDMSSKSKIYSWKIKFQCTSNLIGVGLAYKDIVLKNNNKFFDEKNNNFTNGVFALIQTFNPINNKYCIRPWNFLDKNLVLHVAEFPSFKNGREIIIKYNTDQDRIDFIIKKHVYFIGDVKLNRINNKNIIITPCVIFYYDNDEVIFSEFKCEDIIYKNNDNINNEEEEVEEDYLCI